MNSTNRCQQCQQSLPPGAVLCPKCGAPAPGVFLFQPPQPPVSSGSTKSGRGGRFWLGVSALIGSGVCGCLALVLLLFSFTSGGSSPTTQSQSNPANQQSAPASVDQPAAENPPDVTSTPSEPGANSAITDNGASQFVDDFSNINGGWQDVFEDSYNMGYFQKGNYSIALRTPNKMAVAVPPYPFAKPVLNIILRVKASGEGQDGFFGLLCHYQDNNNYYRASFSGSQYSVDKKVNGQKTALTSPLWKDIIGYQPSPDGYLSITMACVDGRIQIEVNDMGQEIISDTDLTEGDAALFAASGEKPDSSGLYEQAFFDDFSAELQP